MLSQIHRFLSAPLVLTSANLSGGPDPTTAAAVVEQLGDSIPLLLDDGPTRYGGASTVARVMGNRLEILREGVIERAAMNQFVKASHRSRLHGQHLPQPDGRDVAARAAAAKDGQ